MERFDTQSSSQASPSRGSVQHWRSTVPQSNAAGETTIPLLLGDSSGANGHLCLNSSLFYSVLASC